VAHARNMPDGLSAADTLDATAGEIGFVVHRASNRDWAIRDLVNRRHHILALAVGGRAEYQCAGQRFEVTKGDLLFFPRGLAHSGQSDPQSPWSFFSTAFDLVLLDRRAESALERLPPRSTPENFVECQAIFRELERLWVARETGFLLRCRSIVLQLLHAHVRACQGEAPGVLHAGRLAGVVALLQKHPARTFGLEELAEMAELSPSRFRVLFKEYTGHSVVRYQNWLRINRAKDLLLSGEYSVTEAAAETGFDDVYYFSRLFKKLTGINPSHCRNRY